VRVCDAGQDREDVRGLLLRAYADANATCRHQSFRHHARVGDARRYVDGSVYAALMCAYVDVCVLIRL